MAIKRQDYFLECAERYQFDFVKCKPSKGYSQVDTEQDASYYGHWANPFTFELVGFVEGEVTIQQAETKQEFIDLMLKTAKFYKDTDDELNIDPMLEEDQRQEWKNLGLTHLLHESCR